MTGDSGSRHVHSDARDVPDVSLRGSERLARVRRSQARADVTGMTRPPRDADERAFLAARGRLGPFGERANADSPGASAVGERLGRGESLLQHRHVLRRADVAEHDGRVALEPAQLRALHR